MEKNLHDKENFSSKFSPIHSATGDDTVIVNAEQRFREESLESEDIVSDCCTPQHTTKLKPLQPEKVLLTKDRLPQS